MKQRRVELLWNFGLSDEMQILVIERRGDLLAIVDEIRGRSEPIYHYIARLKELSEKKRLIYVRSHLPPAGWITTLSCHSVKEILVANDFVIEPLMVVA